MKKKQLPVKTVLFEDECRDEFSGVIRKEKQIDENYRYERSSILWKATSVFLYRVIMLPFAYCYSRIVFGLRIHGKKKLRPYQKQGYFLIGNHTQVPGDGFFQALVSFPKKSYVIVNSDNVALKGTEQFMLMVGAMPLPTTLKGYKKFLKILGDRCQCGNSIVIYPEAHIWPYYTGIRNFPQTSFAYPVSFKKPIFTFTAVYQKRLFRQKPGIDIEVDGPFFAEEELAKKAAEKKLRDQVYETMVQRAKESNCEYIRYVKRVRS